MDVKTQKIIHEIKQIAYTLNKRGDTLTERYSEVEKALVEAGAGTVVWVDRDYVGRADIKYNLGFSKIGDKWGLVVTEYIDGKHPEWPKMYPVLSAPRSVRVGLASHLDRLVQLVLNNLMRELREEADR